MITHHKTIHLAQTGLRLLRQLDPSVIQRTYETSIAELNEAIEALNGFKPAKGVLVINDEERPIAEKFHIAMVEAIRVQVDYLANGLAKDFADYKRITGVISGLRKAGETYTEQLRINNEN
jgi:hypothetical protein